MTTENTTIGSIAEKTIEANQMHHQEQADSAEIPVAAKIPKAPDQTRLKSLMRSAFILNLNSVLGDPTTKYGTPLVNRMIKKALQQETKND
jgi:hypothetical protein